MAVAAARTTRLASATLAYSHTWPYAPKTTLVARWTRMISGSKTKRLSVNSARSRAVSGSSSRSPNAEE